MSSRIWGPGEAHGDGQESARGTAGADAAATPKGSALTLISYASFLLTLLCVVLAVVVGVANGLLLLATIFAATFAWSVGFFNRAYWR